MTNRAQFVSSPKGARQKVICSLGAWPPKQCLKPVHKVQEALAGQQQLFEGYDPEANEIVEKVKPRRAKQRKPKDPVHEDLVAEDTDGVNHATSPASRCSAVVAATGTGWDPLRAGHERGSQGVELCAGVQCFGASVLLRTP